MKYEHDLQVRLREQYRRLYKTDGSGHFTQSGYFRDFVLGSPALKAIADHIKQSEPELDPAEWVKEKFQSRSYEWPSTEQAKVKVLWYLIQDLAAVEGSFSYEQLARHLTHSSNLNAMADVVTEQVFEPFVEYLESKLGGESMALYHLERLKQRIERFDQEELYAAYQRDTKRGEAVYDRYMQRFLFDQGVDYVIAKARTASGEADIVTDVDSDDAIIGELKLYNGASYDTAYIRKGFNQAVQYAPDYNKTTAHLIVVNLSADNLQFDSDEAKTMWPPRIYASGVTVYVIAIRARPVESASRRGNQKTVVVSRDSLVLEASEVGGD